MNKAALLASALLAITPLPALAEPVLLISIDGLRPGDVLEADKRGLALPNLRRFLTDGAHASGVTGVLPTLTYPSHTTLMTGVSPGKHGIVSNNSFDPMQINQGGWYWYAQDVKVPMLWDAAAKAGLSTGNIHWPVSVAARGISWNLPQIWRTGHADDAQLLDALATPGLKAELERAVGQPYAMGIDESLSGDQNRGRFATALIAAHQPDFLTVYLTALDHEQHGSGPDTPAAKAVLEKIDAIVGDLIAAERKAHPDALIALVSDHGFEATHSGLNLFRPFIDAGLITLGADGKVASWQAMPWIGGGSAAIMLARPDDQMLADKVKGLLDKLAANPANGIDRIVDRAEMAKLGGNPQASFMINLKPGFVTDIFRGANAPLVAPTPVKGMHGYFPGPANLRATFMAMGPGVKPGKDLGLIDMRAIAPTLAKAMGASLPDAEAAPIDLR
ncbi:MULTISPECIES: ectonucleotide pyrophosphatase/phosphodiesterase [Sphingobium]|jgi:predicted AlkP superfamily pyrophosphatase or phosphodiesterase|uniref:Alkaline phosphatase family protein n=1 Tax=Sphingobium yanoikuyae TaxID=13690 RepID=A0A9X7UES6_SPHYA|nr:MULTISPECIES: ectonucleotide pyrophosphatase/phosphodiesterase [Sphingobium]PZU66890.1 MAG: alkaline phosphatase family protein [Sphingobium sp.]QNG47104.1 alkaline phosphatase family protein [Sphingobium yanoikuyae]